MAFTFTKAFGLPLLAKKVYDVCVKRKRKNITLRKLCIVMTFVIISCRMCTTQLVQSFVQISTATQFNDWKVSGHRYIYALEILVNCTCTGLEKAEAWIQRKINEEIKIAGQMKNKCLKRNFLLMLIGN